MRTIIARAGVILAVLVFGSTSFSSAATKARPAKTRVVAQAAAKAKQAKNPFTYKGYVRSYYFTRQNASAGFSAANQASFNTALNLHGDYKFADTPFTLGATYLFASPFSGTCSSASDNAAGLPCVSNKPPALNPDTTLPNFTLNTLYETYISYHDQRLDAKLGNQVYNTPWANASDGRLKPAAFQGGDINYNLSGGWAAQFSDMVKFEGRTASAYDNTTMLTACPSGAPGYPSSLVGPDCSVATSFARTANSGFIYGKLAYAGKQGFSGDFNYYAFNNIAAMGWLNLKYAFPKMRLKPFVAAQGGSEKNTGTGILGKIDASVFGLQGGISLNRNIDFTVAFDSVPIKSETIALPAGVSCGANNGISVAAGFAFNYFLPTPGAGTPNCTSNPGGSTTVYYGGFASPYTDSYATDPLFTTSMTQGMIDRRAPGNSTKFALAFKSDDNRFHAFVTRAYYNYDNVAGGNRTAETDIDAFYFLNKIGKGAYHGFLIRHRYGERTQTFTKLWGGIPDFKYNRTQLEYDF